MKRYLIAVARSFGSGGKAISVELGKQLGIPCYEKEILTMASQQSGINEALFLQSDEKLKNAYLKRILKPVPSDYILEPMDKKFTKDDNLYNIQKEIIRQLSMTQSCIVVGKCADQIFAPGARVLRVFITAPLETCVRSVCERMVISEEEAKRLIQKTNKYRSDYYHYYSGGQKWENMNNYDLCLNTGYIKRENCVEIIKDALRQKFPDVEA